MMFLSIFRNNKYSFLLVLILFQCVHTAFSAYDTNSYIDKINDPNVANEPPKSPKVLPKRTGSLYAEVQKGLQRTRSRSKTRGLDFAYDEVDGGSVSKTRKNSSVSLLSTHSNGPPEPTSVPIRRYYISNKDYYSPVASTESSPESSPKSPRKSPKSQPKLPKKPSRKGSKSDIDVIDTDIEGAREKRKAWLAKHPEEAKKDSDLIQATQAQSQDSGLYMNVQSIKERYKSKPLPPTPTEEPYVPMHSARSGVKAKEQPYEYMASPHNPDSRRRRSSTNSDTLNYDVPTLFVYSVNPLYKPDSNSPTNSRRNSRSSLKSISLDSIDGIPPDENQKNAKKPTSSPLKKGRFPNLRKNKAASEPFTTNLKLGGKFDDHTYETVDLTPPPKPERTFGRGRLNRYNGRQDLSTSSEEYENEPPIHRSGLSQEPKESKNIFSKFIKKQPNPSGEKSSKPVEISSPTLIQDGRMDFTSVHSKNKTRNKEEGFRSKIMQKLKSKNKDGPPNSTFYDNNNSRSRSNSGLSINSYSHSSVA